jgi:hypothetical protein
MWCRHPAAVPQRSCQPARGAGAHLQLIGFTSQFGDVAGSPDLRGNSAACDPSADAQNLGMGAGLKLWLGSALLLAQILRNPVDAGAALQSHLAA